VLVADLLREQGRRRPERIEALVDWGVELSRIAPEEPVAIEVTLEGASGGIYVQGRALVTVRHTCHRCLQEWAETLETDLRELVGGESDYPIEGDDADLEGPVRDAVLVGLPLLPLCRPDCRGLCSVCGVDLNTEPCGGHEEEPAGPFAALRDLLEP
jgi:uncharacterized protein